MDASQYTIFKQGSRTYFYSSIFFPKTVREDVFTLYSFVRVADDFVDCIPQKIDEFQAFKAMYLRAQDGELTGNRIIDGFRELSARKRFNAEWVDAFLRSMEADIYINRYPTLRELDEYLYGSAEVVGLMMARILGLREKAYPAARMLGKAMQYVNFIRDVAEDIELGRIYFPLDELEKYGLSSLDYEHVKDKPGYFNNFIHAQINRYQSWQREAEVGFKHIPRRYLIPVKTASEMYKWTAKVIHKNPLIVYRIKVKPSVKHIISRLSYNLFFTFRRQPFEYFTVRSQD